MSVIYIWQCSENEKHRGWREEHEPGGTCDYCLARTSFEREVAPTGREERPDANGHAVALDWNELELG